MFLFLFFTFNFLIGNNPQIVDASPIKHEVELKSETSDTLPQNVLIDKIFVIGNKKTREQIITRELDIRQKDVLTLEELDEAILVSKNRIFNLGLFTTVDIKVIYLDVDLIDLVVQVQERWFTFPVPVFKLADRNFNEWWVNQNRDLSRVDYGVRFYQYNMRGRNEKLRATAQFGFNQLFDLQYSIPYINRKQVNGLSFFITYAENNNIAYRTVNHKQQFLKAENTIRQTFRTGVTFSHRQNFFSWHYLTLSYFHRTIGDTVATINPNYFLDGRNELKYFYFNYKFKRDIRDIAAYPLKGFLLNLELEKYGLGKFDDLNQLTLNGNYSRYLDMGDGFYLSNRIAGAINFPTRQPYFNLLSLGFLQNYIRGYELYVIEGSNFLINKTTFKKRIFSGAAHSPLIPFEQFQTIPIAIYLKSFFDSGVVNNPLFYPDNNLLSNRYIYGGGMGLDIVTFYDMVLRLEYSMNSIRERGFFINMKAEF